MFKTIIYGVEGQCPGVELEKGAQGNSWVAMPAYSGLQPSLGKGYLSVLRKRNVNGLSKYEKMLASFSEILMFTSQIGIDPEVW